MSTMSIDPRHHRFPFKTPPSYRNSQLAAWNAENTDPGVPNPSRYLCSPTLYPFLRDYHWRGGQTVRASGAGCLLWDRVFSIWHGICTHELPTIWLPTQDLYTDNTSWRSNVNGLNLTRPQPLDEELQTLSDNWERQSKYSPWVSPRAGDPVLNLGSLIRYQP